MILELQSLIDKEKRIHHFTNLVNCVLGSQESVESEARDDTMTVDPNPDIQTKLEAVQKQNLIVQYLGDCVLFTEQMHRVIILVSQLLASKSTSDILESMDFLG